MSLEVALVWKWFINFLHHKVSNGKEACCVVYVVCIGPLTGFRIFFFGFLLLFSVELPNNTSPPYLHGIYKVACRMTSAVENL